MLVLSREPKQKILIADNIVIEILDIRGDRVRLGITAPREVRIDREEIRREIEARHGWNPQ